MFDIIKRKGVFERSVEKLAQEFAAKTGWYFHWNVKYYKNTVGIKEANNINNKTTEQYDSDIIIQEYEDAELYIGSEGSQKRSDYVHNMDIISQSLSLLYEPPREYKKQFKQLEMDIKLLIRDLLEETRIFGDVTYRYSKEPFKKRGIFGIPILKQNT